MTSTADGINMNEYLARLGLTRDALTSYAPRSLELLTLLQETHAIAIPFENLAPARVFPVHPDHVDASIPGQVVSIASDKIFQKLVRDRRGGYCFETNGLFALALRSLGYQVDTIGGRVVLPAPDVAQPYYELQALTHTLLLVYVEGDDTPYLCDVGFGGRGMPPRPMRLCTTASIELATGERYALARAHVNHAVEPSTYGGCLDVSISDGANWAVVYATGPNKPMHPSYVFHPAMKMAAKDYEMANWYCSTSPFPNMTRHPIVALRTGKQLLTLRDNAFSVIEDGRVIESRTIERDELLDLLRDRFGLTP
ncbi:hypothetical protein SPRG_09251 [Saprolegnia parasitica CBS 223.65]|uniref:Uncharacterized protein n=2 Tax=Saprolegnia parasitica TaxID=101203 RepID=A0A067C2W3_SAPPC|nr:hypothetical protein SPRG_09251 [Saprolegnia parasitica CBS 223.65]KDO25109.1 hypothetical protein SPRG_09251 [Saprolegnia parasitica CBS 223.65]CBL43369.1 TPA: arylamine N-acetyltransferase 2 [Saprolegnia parasitica]|eukprot:XP_012204181.1 hypothetical protein SPRG_09251 [Saprolegnia parasitica CBS 223.65]